MKKFIYLDDNFKYTGASHACDIRRAGFAYDTVIRGIIIDKPKIIYIRLNDFNVYQGIEYKRAQYQFKNNLNACEAYLKRNFKRYRVYDSLSITKLPERLQRDILNS